MGFTYEDIVKFMDEYFRDFSLYGQDPKTQQRMNEYFAPDLEFIPYLQGDPKITDREQFYQLNIHPPIQETLKTWHLVVDDRQKIVTAMVNTELKHKKTGEVKVDAWFNCVYHLKLDENNTIKIAKMHFFFEIKPETANVDKLLHPERVR